MSCLATAADFRRLHKKKRLKGRRKPDPAPKLSTSPIFKMTIFIRACIFIFLAAITALAQTVPEVERRAVLLDLASWTEEHTNALVSAETNSDVQDAVDAFLSKKVSIHINGASVKRSDFVKTFEASLPGRTSSNATYSSIIEVPTDATSPVTVRSYTIVCRSEPNYCDIFARLDGLGFSSKSTAYIRPKHRHRVSRTISCKFVKLSCFRWKY